MMFDDLIGKPYKENGRGPEDYDCYGLVLTVCHRLGINLPDRQELLKVPFEKVEIKRPGDIVFIPGQTSGHIGVMENHNTMLQVMDRHPVHRMKINHPWLKDRIEGFYRYAG